MPHGAKLKDLSYNSKAVNKAVLIGAPGQLSGIDLDLDHLAAVLSDATANYGFTIDRQWQTSQDEVMAATMAAATAVGDDGTLFWYFSGHGSADGGLKMNSGELLYFGQVSKKIIAARQKPLKRLIVFADACYAGNLVTGGQEIGYPSETNMANAATGGLQTSALPLAEELLVVTAVDQYTEAAAHGDGSSFTSGVSKAFSDLKAKSGATIGDFLALIKADGASSGAAGGAPLYRAVPEAKLLAEPLIGANSPAANDSGSQPTPADKGMTSSGQTAGDPSNDLLLQMTVEPLDAYSSSFVDVTTTEPTASIILCDGDGPACSAKPTVIARFVLKASPSTGGGLYHWQSQSPVRLSTAHNYSVVRLGEQGAVVSLKTVSLTP